MEYLVYKGYYNNFNHFLNVLQKIEKQQIELKQIAKLSDVQSKKGLSAAQARAKELAAKQEAAKKKTPPPAAKSHRRKSPSPPPAKKPRTKVSYVYLLLQNSSLHCSINHYQLYKAVRAPIECGSSNI